MILTFGRKLICITIIVLISYVGYMLDVFPLKIIFGTLSWFFVPGVIILDILRIYPHNFYRWVIYSVGISILCTTVIGLISNYTFNFLGMASAFNINFLYMIFSLTIFSILIISTIKCGDTTKNIVYIKIGRVSILIGYLIICISVVGAIFHYTPLLIVLPVVILLTVLIRMIVKEFDDCILIFSISLALILQTNLLSSYLTGSDISLEFWMSNFTLQTGYWNASISAAYNSSLLLTIIAPVMSSVTDLNIAWVFKIIFPVMLAMVPVALYILCVGKFGKKLALLSSILFVFVPTYLLEMPSSVKQQVSMFIFAILLMVMFDKKLSKQHRFIMMLWFSISLLLIHYGMSLLYFGFVVCAIVIYWIIRKFFKRFFVEVKFDIRNMAIICVIMLVITGLYFQFTSNGSLIRSLGVAAHDQVSRIIHRDNTQYDPAWETGNWKGSTYSNNGQSGSNGIDTIKAGLGLDFLSVPVEGKIFRVIFIVLDFFAIVGLISMLKKRKLHVMYVCSFLSIAIIALIYVSSSILIAYIGATRLYLMGMLLYAPLIVYGGYYVFKIVFNRYAIFGIALLISTYAIFTSGIIFETMKYDNTDHLYIPYSISISNNRIDIGGVFSHDDISAAEYVAYLYYNNPKIVVVSDFYSSMLLAQSIPWKYDWEWYDVNKLIVNNMVFSPNAYLLFRQKNIAMHEVVIYTGYGLRQIIPIGNDQFDNIVRGRKLLYNGNARVYSPVIDKEDIRAN